VERIVVWLLLAAVYGGLLALMVNRLGQMGFLAWLVLVVVAQLWLARRAKGY